VNESAYYEKGFAMTLAKKVSIKIKENISLKEFLNMVDVTLDKGVCLREISYK